jgi:2-keto-3-deoxy-L-rhamnonate aldolase RhmA
MPEKTNNPIRAALAKGQLLKGPFQLLADRAVTEIMLDAGFDFVLVDAEHRALNPETVEDLIRTAQGIGRSAMVRAPMIARAPIQYILDSGADGILIPLVNSPAQAEEAVSYCRYPPQGTRGLNAATRNASWGTTDPGGYAEETNRDLVVAVQIETIAGLDAVDEIAAVEGIDMLYVGPFDLSHNMGLTGQLNHLDVRAAITKVFKAGRQRGKWLGVLAPDAAFAKWCVGQGVNFLTFRSDIRFLKASVTAGIAEIEGLRAKGR